MVWKIFFQRESKHGVHKNHARCAPCTVQAFLEQKLWTHASLWPMGNLDFLRCLTKIPQSLQGPMQIFGVAQGPIESSLFLADQWKSSTLFRDQWEPGAGLPGYSLIEHHSDVRQHMDFHGKCGVWNINNRDMPGFFAVVWVGSIPSPLLLCTCEHVPAIQRVETRREREEKVTVAVSADWREGERTQIKRQKKLWSSSYMFTFEVNGKIE